MIRASRRAVMAGALAVPTLSGLAAWRWRHGEGRVLLHEAELEAGRRFAEAANAQGLRSTVIEGDRVRFMRAVLAQKPALIAGVSRHTEMQLLADIAQEDGYRIAAELEAKGRQCSGASCRPGWNALGRLGRAAGADWPEALAHWAIDPRGALPQSSTPGASRSDRGLVLGWVLART